MELDDLDRKATTAFEGYVVRKDLVRTFSRQFPVPTYVVEFLLVVIAPPPMRPKSRRAWKLFRNNWARVRSKLAKKTFSFPGPANRAPSKSLTSSRLGWTPKATRMWPHYPACA